MTFEAKRGLPVGRTPPQPGREGHRRNSGPRGCYASRRRLLGWAAAALLLLLTRAVRLGGWPTSFDASVFADLPSRHSGSWAGAVLALAQCVTVLATPWATVMITMGVSVWWCRNDRSWDLARGVGTPVMLGIVAVVVGKALMHRMGPPGTHAVRLLGYYPSGHTTTALVCTAALARHAS